MPKFQKCPDHITALANQILCQFPTHQPLLDARVRIDYVFAFADEDEHGMLKNFALRFHGTRALGIARVIKIKDRVLGRADGEISIDGNWWGEASEEERRALLDHELHHFSVELNSTKRAVMDDKLQAGLKKIKYGLRESKELFN